MSDAADDLSDYREYLEFFDDDSGRRPKLTRALFFRFDEELVDLITMENIRRHSAEQKERQDFLLYLLQSAGTKYREVSRTYRMELDRLGSKKSYPGKSHDMRRK